MLDLKKIRKEKGFTQSDVAIKVGVSLTSYQLWERGVSKPNPENFFKLTEVLGIDSRCESDTNG